LRRPFTLITQLRPEDGRPECELVALLQAGGIIGRVVSTESEVRELAGETVLVMNWLKRIRSEVIHRNRILLNLHNSLLPRYRGRHAFAWAVIRGEREVGYTLHAIDDGFDTGPIYAQCNFPVGADDDINDVFALGHEVLKTWLPDVLERFDAGLLTPIPQDERLASYYPPRSPEDGRIKWTQPGHAIRNFVRALRPPYTPGAFFQAEGGAYHVDRCTTEPSVARYPPGLVLDCDVASNTVQVACGEGTLRLVLVSRPESPTAQDLRPATLLPP
jgi:methionyl-tRNA formyltransferase